MSVSVLDGGAFSFANRKSFVKTEELDTSGPCPGISCVPELFGSARGFCGGRSDAGAWADWLRGVVDDRRKVRVPFVDRPSLLELLKKLDMAFKEHIRA